MKSRRLRPAGTALVQIRFERGAIWICARQQLSRFHICETIRGLTGRTGPKFRVDGAQKSLKVRLSFGFEEAA